MIHKPVLTKEVLQALDPKPGEFMIDGTLGAGGHAAELMNRIGDAGIFLGVDLDPSVIENFKSKINQPSLVSRPKIFAVNDNFKNLPQILAREKLPRADGLLLDLGISSDQLESSGRGFTFQKNEPLLMTFRDFETPVRELLKQISEDELAKIISENSGEKWAKRIADEIKKTLRRSSISTTYDLREAILRAVPTNYERGRIDPATRTFMALRIFANGELKNLDILLSRLDTILKPGGRVAVITFHSSEDRVVKNIFRNLAKQGKLELINKKVIIPDHEEIKSNPRSRSAKLRAAITVGAPSAEMAAKMFDYQSGKLKFLTTSD